MTRSIEDHGLGWSSLWDSGESDLWDRGKASPALVDIIEQKSDLLSPFNPDGSRKKAIVPVGLSLHGNTHRTGQITDYRGDRVADGDMTWSC